MRIGGQEPLWLAVQIGEVAPAAAGNQDLLTGLARMVQHHHAPAAPTGGECAHQASGAGAQDYDVGALHHGAAVRLSRVLVNRPDLRRRLTDAIVPPALQPTVEHSLATLPTSTIPFVVGLIGLLFAGTGVVFSAYQTLNNVAAVTGPLVDTSGKVLRGALVLGDSAQLCDTIAGTTALSVTSVFVSCFCRCFFGCHS